MAVPDLETRMKKTKNLTVRIHHTGNLAVTQEAEQGVLAGAEVEAGALVVRHP